MELKLYEWDARHATIFSALASEFNRAQVRYFILRNHEGLPEVNTSKDVDIIVDPTQLAQARALLLGVFKAQGLTHYHNVNFERANCFYGINVQSHMAIHIDLIAGYGNKGFELFPFSYLYEQTIPYQDFRILSPAMDATMLILYKLIMCRELKPRYRDTVRNIHATHGQQIASFLTPVLGQKLTRRVSALLATGDFDGIVAMARKINVTAKWRAFLRRPLRCIVGIASFLCEKTWRIAICPRRFQKMIAVEAPDGTGKTTFIDNLTEQLAFYFGGNMEASHIFHFRPEWLPNLGAAGEKAGVMKQDTNFTVPHRKAPASPLSSFVRMTYYWLDYVIAMPFVTRRDAQYDRFTIFDRYIYDFLVDPHRTRIQLPRPLRMVYARLVHPPNLTFVLNADAATIYARKQELEPAEIERQLVEFRRLPSDFRSVILLNAMQSPQQITANAISIIIEKFTTKL